jgi:DNA helicase-2/ATP-dependent DNA helicase PcrA
VLQDSTGLPANLTQSVQRRRIEDADYPTSFTEIRYYLHCPKSYQFRERFGMNPVVPEMFGYGQTVHTSIQKIHELHPTAAPSSEEAEAVVNATFHLKHVPPSRDPVNRPGAYERGQSKAVEIAREYVTEYGGDFERERTLEASFEIPAENCVITGSIDLLLREDENGNILQAEIIDFKTMEGGEEPETNVELDWTELSLQVQLYARAADQVLGENARTGSVHLLKDNQRVEVPITDEAIASALENVEWAVRGILAGDFPMRPQPEKCEKCDFWTICPRRSEQFARPDEPPPLHLPGDENEMVRAFSKFEQQ